MTAPKPCENLRTSRHRNCKGTKAVRRSSIANIVTVAWALASTAACDPRPAEPLASGDAAFADSEPTRPTTKPDALDDRTTDDAATDAGSLADAGHESDAGCTPQDVDLVVDRSSLGPSRIFARILYRGQPAALLVDTGSQLTFLSNPGRPDGEPNVGEVTLGCETRSLPGRPFSSDERADGLPVVGFLGNDYFFERDRELDLRNHVLKASAESEPIGWTRLPYENVFDFIFVSIVLDGVPLRLGFDTGAVHTLWLRQAGRPGDTEVSTQDAYGNMLTLYLSTAPLQLVDEPERRVPVLRAPSFPSLEDGNRLLPGQIDGLFGLTSMGDRRIRIDAKRSVIWLSPLP